MKKRKKPLTWKEFKSKDKGYKIGYIIGYISMFFFGLFSCLLVYLVPSVRLPFIIFSITVLVLIRIRRKLSERKEVIEK